MHSGGRNNKATGLGRIELSKTQQLLFLNSGLIGKKYVIVIGESFQCTISENLKVFLFEQKLPGH